MPRPRANRFEYTPAAKGARRLRSIALGYLAAGGAADAPALALAQFEGADNMTDRQGALGVLANGDRARARRRRSPPSTTRYQDDALVLDKWFTTQALSTREDTPDAVEALAGHPDFTIANPNRMRALVGAFAANQYAFHAAVGARLSLRRRHDPGGRQAQSAVGGAAGAGRSAAGAGSSRARGADEAELERIVATPGLSKDVFEQASKSLA